MKISGIDYPIIGKVKFEKLGIDIPVLDIPIMSDERWNELVEKQENERAKKKSPQSSNE